MPNYSLTYDMIRDPLQDLYKLAPTATPTTTPAPMPQYNPLSMLQRVWNMINTPQKPQQTIFGMPTDKFSRLAGTAAMALSPRDWRGQPTWQGRLGAGALDILDFEEEQKHRDLYDRIQALYALGHFMPRPTKPSAFQEYLSSPEAYKKFAAVTHPASVRPTSFQEYLSDPERYKEFAAIAHPEKAGISLVPGTPEAEAFSEGLKLLSPRSVYDYPYGSQALAEIASRYRNLPTTTIEPSEADRFRAIEKFGQAGKFGQQIGADVIKEMYRKPSELEMFLTHPEAVRGFERAKHPPRPKTGGKPTTFDKQKQNAIKQLKSEGVKNPTEAQIAAKMNEMYKPGRAGKKGRPAIRPGAQPTKDYSNLW